jgi:hypothetical protein
METVVLVTNRFWEDLKKSYILQKEACSPFSGIRVIENNGIPDPPGYQFCYYHKDAFIPIRGGVFDFIAPVVLEDKDEQSE